mmetsp:Transcript_78515/g.242319  ORF Transcript_78515/g.242319 Transcript_78515/m.242319 type:complete len:146 (+) Transcript_78515:2315-2752(+)
MSPCCMPGAMGESGVFGGEPRKPRCWTLGPREVGVAATAAVRRAGVRAAPDPWEAPWEAPGEACNCNSGDRGGGGGGEANCESCERRSGEPNRSPERGVRAKIGDWEASRPAGSGEVGGNCEVAGARARRGVAGVRGEAPDIVPN